MRDATFIVRTFRDQLFTKIPPGPHRRADHDRLVVVGVQFRPRPGGIHDIHAVPPRAQVIGQEAGDLLRLAVVAGVHDEDVHAHTPGYRNHFGQE